MVPGQTGLFESTCKTKLPKCQPSPDWFPAIWISVSVKAVETLPRTCILFFVDTLKANFMKVIRFLQSRYGNCIVMRKKNLFFLIGQYTNFEGERLQRKAWNFFDSVRK